MNQIVNRLSLKFCCQQLKSQRKDKENNVNIGGQRSSLKIVDLKGIRKKYYQAKARQIKLFKQKNEQQIENCKNQDAFLNCQARQVHKQSKRKSLLSSHCQRIQRFDLESRTIDYKNDQNICTKNKKSFVQENRKINITCSRQKTVILGGRRKSMSKQIPLSKKFDKSFQVKQRFSLLSNSFNDLSSDSRAFTNMKTDDKNCQVSKLKSILKTDQKTLNSTTLDESNKLSVQLKKNLTDNFENQASISLFNENKENCRDLSNLSEIRGRKQKNLSNNSTYQLNDQIQTLQQSFKDLKKEEKQLIHQINQQRNQFQSQFAELNKKIMRYQQNQKKRLEQIQELKSILNLIKKQ